MAIGSWLDVGLGILLAGVLVLLLRRMAKKADTYHDRETDQPTVLQDWHK